MIFKYIKSLNKLNFFCKGSVILRERVHHYSQVNKEDWQTGHPDNGLRRQ